MKDPSKVAKAQMEGFNGILVAQNYDLSMSMNISSSFLLSNADIVFTATGTPETIGPYEVQLLKPGAFVVNASYEHREIDILKIFEIYKPHPVLPEVEKFSRELAEGLNIGIFLNFLILIF